MKIITIGTGAGNPTKTRNCAMNVLSTANGEYIIDAGISVNVSLVRNDLDINNVRAVFISHMHEDHFGGLTSFLKDRMRDSLRKSPNWKIIPDVWFSDADAIEAYNKLMAVQYRGRNTDMVNFRVIKEGLFFDDGYLKVSAVPTRHIPWQDGYLPTFALIFEAEGKKLVYTGDLAADCSDFPVEAAKDADLCISELTHFDYIKEVKYFQQIKPKKLIFTHVAESLAKKLTEFQKLVDYSAAVANDGDEFEF